MWTDEMDNNFNMKELSIPPKIKTEGPSPTDFADFMDFREQLGTQFSFHTNDVDSGQLGWQIHPNMNYYIEGQFLKNIKVAQTLYKRDYFIEPTSTRKKALRSEISLLNVFLMDEVAEMIEQLRVYSYPIS